MQFITLYAVRRTIQQNGALIRHRAAVRLCAVSYQEPGASAIDYFPRIDQFRD